jgi:hypothetical protein
MKSKGEAVFVLAVEEHRGSRGIAALILNLCTSWGWVVIVKPRLLYPWGKNTLYLLYWGMMISWTNVDIFREEKILVPTGYWTVDFPAHSLVTILTTLSWLHFKSVLNEMSARRVCPEAQKVTCFLAE